MDDMARNADHALAKPHGIARLSTSRGHRRALLHRSARKQTRAWRRQSPKTPGNTGCCIRSKSSRFVAHPFREGNGRVGKLFLHQVAAQSTFQLDFSKVDSEDWNWFSEKSLPASGERNPRWREMIPVFEAMVEDRPQNAEVAEAFQEMMRLFPDAAALEDLAADVDVDEHAYNVPAIDDYGIER